MDGQSRKRRAVPGARQVPAEDFASVHVLGLSAAGTAPSTASMDAPLHTMAAGASCRSRYVHKIARMWVTSTGAVEISG